MRTLPMLLWGCLLLDAPSLPGRDDADSGLPGDTGLGRHDAAGSEDR